MQYIFTYVEQLDLAAQQLEHVEDPAYGRFALILSDNIIELILHKRCQDEMWMEDLWVKMGAPRYTAKEREEVLGRYFAPKVNFAKKLGLITQSEHGFILTCHDYRNELYHTGIRRDDIIYAIAWQHHSFACELLKRQEARSWSPGIRVSEAARRHGFDEKFGLGEGFKKRLEAAARSLSDSKPSRTESLSASLSKSLINRLQSTQNSLNFLIKENPNGLDEAELIEYLQHHQHRISLSPRYEALLFIQAGEPSLSDRLKSVRSSWIPKYDTNPISKWMTRAQSLKQESEPMKALQKHEQIQKETREFTVLIEDAAEYLDGYLMYLSDVARGK
jgi:hypothetical protein